MGLVTTERMIGVHYFKVAGAEYYAKRMPPMQTIHIARRLAPVLLTFRTILADMANPFVANPSPDAPEQAPADAEPAPESTASGDPLAKFAPMVEAFSKLSDDDVELVTRACLSITKTRTAAPIVLWPKEHPKPADQLSSGEILAIVGNVLSVTFGEIMEDLPALGLPGFDATAA